MQSSSPARARAPLFPGTTQRQSRSLTMRRHHSCFFRRSQESSKVAATMLAICTACARRATSSRRARRRPRRNSRACPVPHDLREAHPGLVMRTAQARHAAAVGCGGDFFGVAATGSGKSMSAINTAACSGSADLLSARRRASRAELSRGCRRSWLCHAHSAGSSRRGIFFGAAMPVAANQ